MILNGYVFFREELAKIISTSGLIIGRYEGDEMTPSDIAKKLATFLNTTVCYLLGETEDDNLLKDQDMITRLNEIKNFSDQEKNQICFTLDAVIHEIKNRRTYALAK